MLTDVPETSIGIAAARATRARELAKGLVERGACGLVSFGICGGLIPGLSPGELVLPEAVVGSGRGKGRRFETDKAWRARAEAALSAEAPGSRLVVQGGKLAQAPQVVAEPSEKQTIALETGAGAVDMESLSVGQVASEAGLPFLVVRAICDDAETRIPKAALVGVGASGEVSGFLVFMRLLMRPGDLGGLIRLGRTSSKAHASLGRASRLLGPGFQLL
ncbi:MAG: hypothetical protein ACPGOV_17460 [Magnetovibrionaceae bacterium]